MVDFHASTYDSDARGLSPTERQELDFIVANARACGWLGADQALIAERSGDHVIVRSRAAGRDMQKSYAHGQRWLYELLHDLAQGFWKGRPRVA
jgi:hypothetical protein